MLGLVILLDLPIDWSDKLNLFLVLFSAGLLCVLCALLMAFYLLKSDRFTSKPEDKSKIRKYPAFYKEPRLSRLKNKVKSFFGAIKGIFKRPANKFDDYSYEDFKEPPETPTTPPEEEAETTKKDS